jgi:hypothetical protein
MTVIPRLVCRTCTEIADAPTVCGSDSWNNAHPIDASFRCGKQQLGVAYVSCRDCVGLRHLRLHGLQVNGEAVPAAALCEQGTLGNRVVGAIERRMNQFSGRRRGSALSLTGRYGRVPGQASRK